MGALRSHDHDFYFLSAITTNQACCWAFTSTITTHLFLNTHVVCHVYLSFWDSTDDLLPTGHHCTHDNRVGHHTEEKQIDHGFNDT